MANPEAEARLAAHLRDTYPTSRDSFLGKEHFWALGEEVGIQRRYAGGLFTELCFPVRGNPRLFLGEVSAVDPETIGLVVSTRYAIGMPNPPVRLTPNYPPKPLVAHGVPYLDKSKANRAVTERVVQIQGIIDLGQSPQTVEADFTAKTIESLGMLMPRLAEFPAS